MLGNSWYIIGVISVVIISSRLHIELLGYQENHRNITKFAISADHVGQQLPYWHIDSVVIIAGCTLSYSATKGIIVTSPSLQSLHIQTMLRFLARLSGTYRVDILLLSSVTSLFHPTWHWVSRLSRLDSLPSKSTSYHLAILRVHVEFLGYQGDHLCYFVKSTSYHQHLQYQEPVLSFLAIRDITRLWISSKFSDERLIWHFATLMKIVIISSDIWPCMRGCNCKLRNTSGVVRVPRTSLYQHPSSSLLPALQLSSFLWWHSS